MTDNRILNADNIVMYQQEQWSDGHCVRVEELLIRNSWLNDHPETLLDLIYSEILLREDQQESPTEEEYLQRFPQLQTALIRQFQVHRALQIEQMEDEDSPFALTATFDSMLDDTDSPKPTLPQTRNIDTDEDSFPEIPGFTLLSVAGRGGNGLAYRAFDTSLKRVVAVKLLTISTGMESTQSRQLLREAEAAAALVHPSIVRVFQVGKVGKTPFLVMEFIDGGSLADRLKKGPMPTQEAVNLCQKVAQAIEYAHGRSIIHRDLKPGNILLDSAGHPHVCDFGLARKLGSDDTMHITGDVIGTPAYMPPEQARGEKVDVRADVYALGAILYESLCGRPPYQAATSWEILHQVLTCDVLPLRHLNSTLPVDLETICARCLEKDPQRRYGSAQEICDELQRFQSGRPITARPLGRIPRLLKWVRRNPGVASVVSVVAVSLLSVAVVASLSQRRVSEALTETQQALLKAETQRDVALDAMNDLVYRVHDDLQKREASVEARREVLESAIAGLQKIMNVAGEREDTRRTLATALTRLGYILTQQGKNEEAEVQYLRSIEVADLLQSDDGQEQRAQNYSNLALFYVRAANFEKVEEWANRTLKLAEELLEVNPDSLDLKNIAVQAKTQLASAAGVLKDAATAFTLRQEAQQACAQLIAEHPDELEVRDQLVDINLLLIQDCLSLQRRTDAASYVDQCLKILETQSPATSEDVQIQRRYCTTMRFQGILQFSEADYEASLASVQKAIDGYSRLVNLEPNRPGFHLRLGTMHEVMADCHLAMGHLDECERHARLQISETEAGIERGGPTYAIQRFAVAKGYIMLGNAKLRKNEMEAFSEAFRKATEVLEPILDLYNTREIHASVSYNAEIAAALAGQPHQADEADVAAIMRVVSSWQALSRGDGSIFAQEEQQIINDLQAATRTETKSLISNQLALCYALRYNLLRDAADPDESQILDAENQCIAAIRQCPDADPLMHVRYVEFERIRSSERFREAFSMK